MCHVFFNPLFMSAHAPYVGFEDPDKLEPSSDFLRLVALYLGILIVTLLQVQAARSMSQTGCVLFFRRSIRWTVRHTITF